MKAAGGPAAVARALGVHPDTIQRYQRGDRDLPAERLARLYELAGLEPGTLPPPAAPAGQAGKGAGKAPKPPKPKGLKAAKTGKVAGGSAAATGVAAAGTPQAVGQVAGKIAGQVGQALGMTPDPTVLTPKEADTYRPVLIEAFEQASGGGDWVVQHLSADRQGPADPIWQLTPKEASVMADLLISEGQRSKAVAAVVRVAVTNKHRAAALLIIVPRLIMSGDHIRDHGGLAPWL